jgi:hypothetical protein
MLDLLGHTAYGLIVVGTYGVAAGWGTAGWGLRTLGDVLWCYIGLELDMTSIWLWESVFVGVDLYGLLRG